MTNMMSLQALRVYFSVAGSLKNTIKHENLSFIHILEWLHSYFDQNMA